MDHVCRLQVQPEPSPRSAAPQEGRVSGSRAGRTMLIVGAEVRTSRCASRPALPPSPRIIRGRRPFAGRTAQWSHGQVARPSALRWRRPAPHPQRPRCLATPRSIVPRRFDRGGQSPARMRPAIDFALPRWVEKGAPRRSRTASPLSGRPACGGSVRSAAGSAEPTAEDLVTVIRGEGCRFGLT